MAIQDDRKFYFFETDYETLKGMKPKQRAEYVMLMCEFFFDGVDTNPNDIKDTKIQDVWRYRRKSLNSSLKNIRDYEKKKAKKSQETEETDTTPESNEPQVEKTTVFVDMAGKMGTYTPNIYTKTQTYNQGLITYKNLLNQEINKYKDYPAEARYCENLWMKLKDLKTYRPTVINTDDVACLKEIDNAVETIGNQIAYYVPRPNVITTKKYDINTVNGYHKGYYIHLLQNKNIQEMNGILYGGQNYKDWLYKQVNKTA